MARRDRSLSVTRRAGHDITVEDGLGQAHDATLTKVHDDSPVRDEGSFTFGYCKSCNWVGPARRARGKARRDAEAHHPECEGKGSIRIGVTDA